MADGKISIPNAYFFGFKKDEKGLPKIIEKQTNSMRCRLRWNSQKLGRPVNCIALSSLIMNVGNILLSVGRINILTLARGVYYPLYDGIIAHAK